MIGSNICTGGGQSPCKSQFGRELGHSMLLAPCVGPIQNMGLEAQQASVGIVGDTASSPLVALRWRTRASSSLTLLPDTTHPCSLDGSARTCRRPCVVPCALTDSTEPFFRPCALTDSTERVPAPLLASASLSPPVVRRFLCCPPSFSFSYISASFEFSSPGCEPTGRFVPITTGQLFSCMKLELFERYRASTGKRPRLISRVGFSVAAATEMDRSIGLEAVCFVVPFGRNGVLDLLDIKIVENSLYFFN
jgi:hypothetical protein